MLLITKKKIWFLIGLIPVLFALIYLIMLFVPEKANKLNDIASSTDVQPETFTFFNIGTNTVLTETLRESLSEKLGSESVAQWSTIDLSMNFRGFLEKYSKELYALNAELNDASGARIEHNTITLTYRYPLKDETIFNYIRLMFSNYTQRPLLFIVRADKQGSTILNTLIEKYGKPVTYKWDSHQGISHHWQKGKDVLILSQSFNRIGHPEFYIHIYYVNNINELLLAEKKEALKQERERKRMGREAF